MIRTLWSRARIPALVTGGLLLAVCVLAGPAALVAAVAADPVTGSIAEWVTASTTIGALAAAVYAGIQAGRVVRIEQRRDDSAQARQVAAWGGAIQLTTDRPVTFRSAGQPRPPSETEPNIVLAKFAATVRNASPLPVFNAWLQVYVAHPDGVPVGGWQLVADHHLGIVLPDGDLEVDLVGGRPIGEHEMWFGDPQNPVYQAFAAEFARRGVRGEDPPEMAVGWSFRDVAGTYWVHKPGGELVKADRPQPAPTARTGPS